MDSLFDWLPDEIILKIFSYMTLENKEYLTYVFPNYYRLFVDSKKRFLEENYQVNYKPLVKKGIDYYLENNTLCVRQMLRKKRFYIDSFPKPLRDSLIDYDTPIIPYQCSFRKKSSGIFHCNPNLLKYKISVGKYPSIRNLSAKSFIFIKTRYDEVICIWERDLYGGWDCYFGELVHSVIGQYYINFKLLDNIMELL